MIDMKVKVNAINTTGGDAAATNANGYAHHPAGALIHPRASHAATTSNHRRHHRPSRREIRFG
ncbi:MAG TPA: hypothetical protein VLI90_09955 [Tepidisphaeraceae bacterium]|nr:hypothetical protein [Tepidisphaeraceae bacterium]